MKKRALASLVVGFTMACGPSAEKAPEPVTAVVTAPSASAPSAAPSAPPPAETSSKPSSTLAPLPTAFRCDAGTGPAIPRPPPDASPVPVAGQMTEDAAQAKRLYDAERWKDASAALARVMNGDTGDDEGNRQIAQYHYAITLYRLHREQEAIDVFRAPAKRTNHLKHNETALWLAKMLEQNPQWLHVDDFASYTREQIGRFDNPPQRAVFLELTYALGRERLAEGNSAEGKALLVRLPDDHPYASAAKTCLAAAK